MPTIPQTRSRRPTLNLVPVVAIAAIVFWITAYPTITWWDSSQYSLAARTLGVTGPPGSLLLTLLGWLVTRLPLGAPAHVLNLLAGVLAALAVALVYRTALRLRITTGWDRAAGSRLERNIVVTGVAAGALTFAFGETLWEHAIKFTPYVLTAVFTGLILWTMLRWWETADEPDAWHRLALLGLLFGLDFSVHRTNALLLPALLAWILLRRPRTLRDPRAWLGGASAMVAGLSVQLLIIPIAASTHSVLNIGEPRTLGRLWNYVSLQMMGGGFLVHFFPRNAPFWSAQVGDLLRVLGANFFRWDGPLGPLGVLPALGVLVGIVHLWRRDARLGVAWQLVVLLQAAMTVLYFNIPANFFRPLDRHYLPVCVTLGILMAFGFGALAGEVARLAAGRRRLVAGLGGILLLLAPVTQISTNWTAHDASRRFFARDFAANLLEGLPQGAIVFTNGDNDTFPLLYVQAVEGIRPDVQIINRSLANTTWYVDQLVRRDPSFPLSMTPEARDALAPRRWSDTTIVIPVEGTAEHLALPPVATVPDAITLDATPTAGDLVLPVDLVLLDLLHTNRWRRPVCFSVTVGETGVGWLRPYARLDGLFWRTMPIVDPPLDLVTLRTNLLETYAYRGYADAHEPIDAISLRMGLMYQFPFTALIQAEADRSPADCRATVGRYAAALPPARLGTQAPATAALERMCGPSP